MFICNPWSVTHFLTPWSRDLPEKPTDPHLVRKFHAFYGTQRFITTFARARHLCLSWARLIQSMPSQFTSRRSSLMLPFHHRVGLPICLLTSCFPHKIHVRLVCHISRNVLINSAPSYWLSCHKSPRLWRNNVVLGIGHSASRTDKKCEFLYLHRSVVQSCSLTRRVLTSLRPVAVLIPATLLVAKECIMQHEPNKGIHYAVQVLGDWRVVIYYPCNALVDLMSLDGVQDFVHCITAFVLHIRTSWLELSRAL